MSEKTEDPTPKRLRDARKRGEIPKSRDLTSAVVLLVAAATFSATGAEASDQLLQMMRGGLTNLALERHELMPRLFAMLTVGTGVLLPVVLAALVTGTSVAFLQVGGLLTLEPVSPKLSRIDPIEGTKRLFSQRQLIEFLKTLLKLIIIGYVAVRTLRESSAAIGLSAGRSADAMLPLIGSMAAPLIYRVAGAFLAIAAVDVLYQRWRFRQDQRMSKDEVKREHKEAEGDPHAKGERKRMHQEIIEHNTLEGVRSADVLVVNPTHIAVALRYDEEEHDAPEVVARGQEHLAKKMIAAAEEAGVPIMRDIPLARSLFALELGESIPEPLFDAVAAVLHAAWKERAENELEEHESEDSE